jgi:peptide/nickel transport system permease protein
MLVSLVLMSFVTFVVIQLPPGDFVTSRANALRADGQQISREQIETWNRLYGIDRPMLVQYAFWVRNMAQGTFGMSFAYNRPVIEVIGERFLLTILISVVTLLFSYLIAIPIGVYSATRQYSGGDYVFSFMGFIGMAVPNFILAMIAMYLANRWFGISIGGLFSAQYQSAAWSGSKVADLLAHLPVPVLVIGIQGTAGTIRTLRACMLDELKKQYVTTARAKGLRARTVIYRYPLRIAMNPLVSGMSRILADIVSGSTITAIVLNLPTMGPLLQDALMQQDTYLAGAAILLQCALVLVGTLLSDIILVAMDPRIRLER